MVRSRPVTAGAVWRVRFASAALARRLRSCLIAFRISRAEQPMRAVCHEIFPRPTVPSDVAADSAGACLVWRSIGCRANGVNGVAGIGKGSKSRRNAAARAISDSRLRRLSATSGV
jgi:hypothetical protein